MAIPQQNKVVVDGQDQGVVQKVHCGTMTDGLKIKISMGDHGVVAILSDANPPGVKGVQFSNTFVNGGVTLEYDSRKNEGNGNVTKQGNTYRITGTGVGKDKVSKPFEIDVTCP
jgi:lipoprotein LpqH